MTEAAAPQPSQPPAPATVADVMHPPVTTVEQGDHVAAAAYLMHRAGATALVVVDDEQAKRPIGLITEADIVQAVAADKDLHEVKIRALMTNSVVVMAPDTSVRDAARTMISGHFRHLPVVANASLIGMVGISEVCDALLHAARLATDNRKDEYL